MSDHLQNRYRYAILATNRVYELVGDAEQRPVGELASAAAQAADALDQLLEDRRFNQDLERWRRLEQTTMQEQMELLDELEGLATRFVKIEKQALRRTPKSADGFSRPSRLAWAESP